MRSWPRTSPRWSFCAPGKRSTVTSRWKGAWLFTIANNLIVDHHRRTRHVAGDLDPSRHKAATPDPEESAIGADLNDRILAAIARLKPEYQLIVSLRLIEDMEYEDIARVMGKKPGALRVLLFRALAALREDLARRGVAP
jgi:RNA polymerase sigma-70 factor (ECF subfamily)